MDIKKLKPNKNALTEQGYINIQECRKYVGTGPIIYRSSWEKLFCEYCEKCDNIIEWSSESITIPYFDTVSESNRKYYPDFQLKTKDGTMILVEIKPEKYLTMPEEPKRKGTKKYERFLKHKMTVETNICKIRTATKYCADRSWVFRIITEKFIAKLK